MAFHAPRRHVLLLGIAALLAGCGAAPVQPQWAVAPLLRVDHAGGDEAAALYRVGRYHQQRGELSAAAEAFTRSIALQPDQLDARNAQAVLLADQGRTAEAIALLEQLVAAYPSEAQPMNNLGYLYYLQGRQQKARTALAQALRLHPQHAQARANLARLPGGSTAPDSTAPGSDAPGSVAGSAAPADTAAAPQVAAATDTAKQSRLQLVQLAPNEFRLQERLTTETATATATMTAATARTATPADVPAKPADADSGGAPIQIVNGNGVPGLGERTRRLLARVDRHAANADVVNKRRRDQRTTIIEYLPGQRERARLMQAALPGPALLLPARALPDGLALRLVLGHDQVNASAKPLRLPSAPLLTMNSTAVPHFNQE